MRRTSSMALAAVTATALLLVAAPTLSQSPDSEGTNDVPSAREVIDKLDTLYRSDSSHSIMEMTVKKPRGTRELKLESWSQGEEHMLVVIREPAREAGTATLRTPDGLWNYLPRADRLMRIPSGLLSDSWMGSHFSNDDLMRETSYDDDYKGSVEATEFDGRKTLKLALEPKPNAPVVYSKLVFWVTRNDYVPIEQKFYDEGEVVRTMTFSNVEKIEGRLVPKTMTLRPADAEDEYTRMSYESLEFDVDIDDDLFSKRGLRRRAD